MVEGSIEIRPDDVRGAEIVRLLELHLKDVALYSPPESTHALDLDGLRAPNVTMWSAWRAGNLLGCAALKELDPHHAEIKSMRTDPAYVRQGVASALLRHLVDEAARRGYDRLSLETGTPEAFAPARALYERQGFTECGPFAAYVEDPYSVFMALALPPLG